jgi:hypothetical protein
VLVIARTFFEDVREAARDAERVRLQLQRLEQQAAGMGAQGFEPRTRSTPDPHRMESGVIRIIERERQLEARVDADYELLGRASRVLYGPAEDGRGGVASHVGTLAADALWWRYCADSQWKEVASALGSSVTTVQAAASYALEWLDETGEWMEG